MRERERPGGHLSVVHLAYWRISLRRVVCVVRREGLIVRLCAMCVCVCVCVCSRVDMPRRTH